MVSYSHFVVEGPVAVLAAVELALLVDSIAGIVKRRPLSALGADNGGAFSFLFRVVDHLFKLSLSRNEKPLVKVLFLGKDFGLYSLFQDFLQRYCLFMTRPSDFEKKMLPICAKMLSKIVFFTCVYQKLLYLCNKNLSKDESQKDNLWKKQILISPV
jgi:hypothetical protein